MFIFPSLHTYILVDILIRINEILDFVDPAGCIDLFFFICSNSGAMKDYRLLTFPVLCSQIIIIFLSNLASTIPTVIVSRECESAWCVPLPWDTFLGAGSAAVDAFGGILNGFVKPQLPTTPPTTNDEVDDDDENSDERASSNEGIELDVYDLPGIDQNQCQKNVLDLQPGDVSFFAFFCSIIKIQDVLSNFIP